MKTAKWIVSIGLAIQMLALTTSVYSQMGPNEQTMHVTTQGDVEALPDVARMKFKIQKQNLLASRAISEVRQESQRFREVLTKAKIENDENVIERGINIGSQTDPYTPRQQGQAGGFMAVNEFTIQFPLDADSDINKVLDRVAEILDVLNPEGFTPISYPSYGPYGNEASVVQFVVTQYDRYMETCVKKAIEKNRPEADKQAAFLGLKIVEVKNSIINSGPYVFSGGLVGGNQEEPNTMAGVVYKPYKITYSVSITYKVEDAAK